MKRLKKGGWFARLAALAAICCALSMTTVSLAAEAGSAADPLVTLSYLNDTFLGTVMQKVDQKIAARNSQIGVSSGTAASFAVVTLSSGQTLKGSVGCEVMLRVGGAVCVASANPGLVDETSGATLTGGGALVQNHLYMMTFEDRGVKAGSATVKLLVRGTYTVA